LLTFFAAAKKVSAAPHRGDTNRPIRIQGKANTTGTTTKKRPPQAKTHPHPKDFPQHPHDFAVVISADLNPSDQNGYHLQRTPANPIQSGKKP
jgi:hypothetical protein